MASTFVIASWKACIGKYISPHNGPLYRYEERPTPRNYAGQHKIQAFSVSRDQVSRITRLHHNGEIRDGITLEFSDTSNLPQSPEVDKLIGWYFDQQGLASFYWGDLKPGTEAEIERKLEKKDKFRWIREKEGHIGGLNQLWVIRGYFIGPDENNAPPCITVLCAYEDVARFLVDRIHGKLHLHQGWGATRLPGVKVLKLASGPGSDDSPDNTGTGDELPGTTGNREVENLIQIDIGHLSTHSMPTMTNRDLPSWAMKQHRCGIQVEIVRGSEVISKATIGGLITVGDGVYGLTVGHLFSPSASDEKREAQRLSVGIISTMAAWKEGKGCGMEFDWALVKIPGLQKQDVESWMDVNLVQTVSGEFRPVLVTFHEPSPYTQVVVATPGSQHCLRGVMVGCGAIVNIPGSPTIYTTWVCRMELPWLLQSGDSGSWVLDAENGMLLGVLVAGCPELQEAYIIPAHEIIDDIKRHHPDHPDLSVNLPNCHPLPRTAQNDLQRLVDQYGCIIKSAENINSPQELERLDNRISYWFEKAKSFTDIHISLYTLRPYEESAWRFPLSVLQYKQWASNRVVLTPETNSNYLDGKLRDAIQQNPLGCHTTINRILVADEHPSRNTSAMLRRLWPCLILGLRNYFHDDEVIPGATKLTYDRIMEREVRLMTYKTSTAYLGPRSPWEKDSVAMFCDTPSKFFPWQNHASAHTSPDPYLSLDHWDLFNRTTWPPWDRLTAREALYRLGRELRVLITTHRISVELSLPETRLSQSWNWYEYVMKYLFSAPIPDSPFVPERLEPDSDIVLVAVKAMRRDYQFLVIFPPPSVGISDYIQNWPDAHNYPEYAISNYQIAYSPWRLPFIIAENIVSDEENLELLLSTQLGLHLKDFKDSRRLDLRHDHSKFYLTEFRRYVDVIIYEGYIDDEPEDMKHGLTGWMMNWTQRRFALSHLSPPFSAILHLPN
ncbi:hypothetical protein SNK04_010889 [Fusarium graminearum]